MMDNEQIKLIAEQLLPGFLPKEQEATSLTFFFTVPPVNYEVRFARQKSGEWVFVDGKPAP